MIIMGSAIAIETTIIYRIKVKNSSDYNLKNKLVLVCGGIILGFGAEMLAIVGAHVIATELKPHPPCVYCPYPAIEGLQYVISGITMFPLGLFLVLSSIKR